MDEALLIYERYKSLYENASILVPRRTPEERKKNHLISIQKTIQEYMKNGSKGDLNLQDTPITSLPEGLKVGGDLDLSNTPITSLPEGLKVGGCLYLNNTPITSLPEGFIVGGNLHLNNTPIRKKYTREQLTEMLPNVRYISG
jgi:hypothetical protein